MTITCTICDLYTQTLEDLDTLRKTPNNSSTHKKTHLLTHSVALTQPAFMLWILALWGTWLHVVHDLPIIQLLTEPSSSVSAISPLTLVQNFTP